MIKNNENELLFKQPSAWIPIAISLAMMTFLLAYATIVGINQNHGADEGAPARIFQLFMLLELPVMAYFAFRWLPKRPTQAVVILGLQAVAWIIPIVTVILLESR